MTARQRFYANYAFSWCENARPDAERMQITTDPHSLAQYRVNIPLSNQADFAKAFGCKPGQPMVRSRLAGSGSSVEHHSGEPAGSPLS